MYNLQALINSPYEKPNSGKKRWKDEIPKAYCKEYFNMHTHTRGPEQYRKKFVQCTRIQYSLAPNKVYGPKIQVPEETSRIFISDQRMFCI